MIYFLSLCDFLNIVTRGGQKYRYGNISQYFAAQYNIDFSTPNIDKKKKKKIHV